MALVLGLGVGRVAARAPWDPDYGAEPATVEEYENLGEGYSSDDPLDEGTVDEAADQALANAPEVAPPSAVKVEQSRAGLEADWGGNLPALWSDLDRIAGHRSAAATRQRRVGTLGLPQWTAGRIHPNREGRSDLKHRVSVLRLALIRHQVQETRVVLGA